MHDVRHTKTYLSKKSGITLYGNAASENSKMNIYILRLPSLTTIAIYFSQYKQIKAVVVAT